jgi:hypothetical protein
MPTLRELFQTKILKSGQTAEQQYEIQNLKPVPVKTNSGAIDLFATPVTLARRNQTQFQIRKDFRLKETRFEEELLGIRQIRAFASPVLYGTAIAKLKLKQSSSVITMKNASSTLIDVSGTSVGGGLVAKLVEKAKDVGKGVLSKLGIQLPEAQIPTRVANKITGQLIFAGAGSPISPDKLRQIKEQSQGNGVGKILASIGQGATGEQIKNQVLGAGINAAKKAATKALFGAVDRISKTFKSVEGTATPSIRPADASYNSKRKYSRIIKIRSDFDGSTFDFGNHTSLTNLQDYVTGTQNLANPIWPEKLFPLGVGLMGQLAAAGAYATQPEGLFIRNKAINDVLNYANPAAAIFTTKSPFPQFSLGSITQNIPAKRDLKADLRYSRSPGLATANLLNRPGKFTTTSDKVNQSLPWHSADGEIPKDKDDKTLDDYDFIPLRFYSIAKETGVSFKATLSGLEETFSPSWDSHRFVGSPYNFYTYNSIERSVSFTFKVYSLNSFEHIRAWHRLNFLAALVYPQNTKFEEYTTPPFIKFTIGDMYKNREGFFESLSFSIDDTTPWEIGYGATKTGNRIDTVEKNFMKDYRLPTIINVSLTIKLLDNITTVAGKRLYGYNGKVTEFFSPIGQDGTKKASPKEPIGNDNKGVGNKGTAESKLSETKISKDLKDTIQNAVSNQAKTFRATEGQLNEFTSGYENMRI